jgi:DNA-nicking Smr family endonuclease
MPFLNDEDLRRLTGYHDSAEYELDLRGLDLAHARASIERMLERSRFRPPRTVVIRIDKASATSGVTLFQPIGRQLVDAMKAGLVLRCRPLPDGNAGFWTELSGNPRTAGKGDGIDEKTDGGEAG